MSQGSSQVAHKSMHEKLDFRLVSSLESRLGRWGMYKRWHRRSHSSRPSHAGVGSLSSWWGSMIMSPRVQGRGNVARLEDPCPVDRDEAQQTERCIAALDPDLAAVIRQAYLEAGTIDEQIYRLGCCRQTYYNRLARAYAGLLELLGGLAAGGSIPSPQISASPNCDG